MSKTIRFASSSVKDEEKYWKMVCLYQNKQEKEMYYLEVSGRPSQREIEHNRKGKQTCRYTKDGSPHWKLALMIGPLLTGAHSIKKEWESFISKYKTKNFQSAYRCGLSLIEQIAKKEKKQTEEIGWHSIG